MYNLKIFNFNFSQNTLRKYFDFEIKTFIHLE